MFPDDIIQFRPMVNRPGLVYDADKLSTLFVEDLEVIVDNIAAVQEYVLELPTTEQIIAYSIVL